MEPVNLGKWEGSPKHSMGEGPWRGMILGTAFADRETFAEKRASTVRSGRTLSLCRDLDFCLV